MMDLQGKTGYRPNPETQQAICSLLEQKGGGARALLVTGEAGTGKTALAEAVAATTSAKYFYVQLHTWTDPEKFFDHDGAGTAEKGFLTLVAEATQDVSIPLVVACLDEMDKASEAFEAVFLDWLQTGRVPGKPGEHFMTRLDRLIVIVTSNGMREHTEPFMRRCRRLRMERMSHELAVALLVERTRVSEKAADLTVKLAHACERVDDTVISLQEMMHFLNEAQHVCESLDSLKFAVVAWLMRRDEPENILRSFDVQQLLPKLWEEIKSLKEEGA